MSHSADLSREIQFLRFELQKNFRQGEWSGVAVTLETVAKVGEVEGQKELCLRAQSLRELMGSRWGGRSVPGPRIEELFDDLMSQLAHFQWLSQTTSH